MSRALYQVTLSEMDDKTAHMRTWTIPRHIYELLSSTFLSVQPPNDEGIISKAKMHERADVVDDFMANVVTKLEP